MVTENGFVNRTAELEFILTKLDGRVRCDMLQIQEHHYESRQSANEWHQALVAETAECSPAAKAKLQDLYENMIFE